ncbi:MAG: ATP-binding protein [Vicingaceae bacterium]
MKINVFGFGLFIRVLMLLSFCVLAGLIFWSTDWIFTQIFLLAFIFLVTFEISRYVSKTNRDVSRLLETLKYEEYSITFLRNKESSRYADLHQKMEEIKLQQEAKTKKQSQATEFYKKILNNFNSGVLLFDNNFNIIIQSNHVAKMLGLPIADAIEDIEKAVPDLSKRITEANDHSYIELKTTTQNFKCQITKFKSDAVPYTLMMINHKIDDPSGDDFETWVNFSKVISHEILNGISPLISLTATLQEKVSKIEKNEKLKESMQKALSMIMERTESLQAYSERYRILHRLPEPSREQLIWRNVIHRALAILREELDACEIKATVEGSCLDKPFKADRWQMEQIFSNLILNSINAFEEEQIESKCIRIQVEEERSNFVLTFSDNGPGIEKDMRAKIFVPFFTSRESGSGIGLSVIKQILWKHNAEIFLSDSDKGASFIIRFPKI